MTENTKPTKIKADLSKFFVVTVISNPVMYKRRYELYWRFKDMCESAGVQLITVEQAFGHRPWILTTADNPYNLQVRTVEELWHKENMINLGIKHALATFGTDKVGQVAWIDADCRPAYPPREWFERTRMALDHYEFVQMWEWLLSLDPNDNGIGVPGPSFMANYVKYGTPYPKGIVKNPYGQDAPSWGSPGLAWAANVDALNKVGCGLTGPLNDWGVLGAGDWYWAHACIDDQMLPGMDKYTEGYRKRFARMQALFEKWIKGDVGYVQGMVLDDWHGKKVNRGYNTREQILIKYKFDPDEDLKIDSQGLLQLETHSKRQRHLRDHFRAYFRRRHEDDISV